MLQQHDAAWPQTGLSALIPQQSLIEPCPCNGLSRLRQVGCEDSRTVVPPVLLHSHSLQGDLQLLPLLSYCAHIPSHCHRNAIRVHLCRHEDRYPELPVLGLPDELTRVHPACHQRGPNDHPRNLTNDSYGGHDELLHSRNLLLWCLLRVMQRHCPSHSPPILHVGIDLEAEHRVTPQQVGDSQALYFRQFILIHDRVNPWFLIQ